MRNKSSKQRDKQDETRRWADSLWRTVVQCLALMQKDRAARAASKAPLVHREAQPKKREKT